MQAIVLVNQDSPFAHLNYQTFQVVDMPHLPMSDGFFIDVNNRAVLLTVEELIIVDAISELTQASEPYVQDDGTMTLSAKIKAHNKRLVIKYLKFRGILK